MAPRTGRPPVEHPREYVLRIRLTDDERATIEEAAERGEMPPATWARERLLAAAKRKR